MGNKSKRLGIGTLSIPLIIGGILFSFSWFGICYGDIILQHFGIKSWSNGNTGIHYTAFYSLIFFVPAFLLAFIGKSDIGAKTGRILSSLIILFFFCHHSLYIKKRISKR